MDYIIAWLVMSTMIPHSVLSAKKPVSYSFCGIGYRKLCNTDLKVVFIAPTTPVRLVRQTVHDQLVVKGSEFHLRMLSEETLKYSLTTKTVNAHLRSQGKAAHTFLPKVTPKNCTKGCSDCSSCFLSAFSFWREMVEKEIKIIQLNT